MLTAAQIDVLRDAAGQLLDPVTDFLIEDIARRVSEAGQLTGTAAYQVWRAQNLGMSQKKLKKALQEKLNVSEEELEKLLQQAAETGYNFDLSRLPTSRGIPFAANSSIQQIVAAAVKQANKDLTNITRTMGFVGSDGKPRELTKAYKKACDDAFMRTVTGAQDYNSAIRDALKGLSEKGIVSIDYASGKHFTIESAVRQNIMGGLGLMQEQISEQNHDDLGCDGWEISAHGGCAPDHEPIQGRQYTDKEYKVLNDSLLRRIGTLNCGHAAYPIIMGVHSPQYTEEELEDLRQQNEKGVTVDGRHYTGYEATQRQRQLERAIRGQKRKILIDKTVGDEEKLQNDQIKLVRLRDEYARFSKAAGLPTQHARAEAAGFTWKEGKAAERAAKMSGKAEHNEPLDLMLKKEYNIKTDQAQYEKYRLVLHENAPETFEDFQNLKYGDSEKWENLKYQYRTVNRYEARGNVKTEAILQLDDAAWKTKQTGFNAEGLAGKAKRKVKDLAGNGNAAVLSLDGKTYFAHSRVSRTNDPGFNEYNGQHPLIALKEKRRFDVLDLGDGVPRYHDTEAKFIEFVADIKAPTDVFDVTILSEKHICKSCEYVVEQFQEMFPNATVNIISGKPDYNKSPEGRKTWKHRKKVKTNG